MYVNIYTYIYIYTERERERERDVYIYIYIYISTNTARGCLEQRRETAKEALARREGMRPVHLGPAHGQDRNKQPLKTTTLK